MGIGNIHNSKITEALQNREMLIKKREERNLRRFGSMANHSMRGDSHRISTQSMQRPISAQTSFSASFHHTLRNMVKQNNEYRQANGIRPLSSVTGKTMRPQTAATYKSFNTKTFDRRSAKSSYSLATLPTPGKSKKKKGVKVNDIEFTGEVNENDQVIFENIPKAVYSITTLETPFFQKGSREVDIFSEKEENNCCQIYLPLDRQQTSCTTLFFPKTRENSKDFDPDSSDPQYLEDLQVRAWMIENYDTSEKDSNDGEETEYEEELVFDPNSGGYRAGLVPGIYLLMADGEGLQNHTSTIQVYN